MPLADDVTGLVGWGAVAFVAQQRNEATTAANEQPWGHLDLLPG